MNILSRFCIPNCGWKKVLNLNTGSRNILRTETYAGGGGNFLIVYLMVLMLWLNSSGIFVFI